MSRPVDVTIILDRSGSMQSTREATVKGVNDFIRSVNEVPGEGAWTLLQFDDRDSARGAGEEFPHCVFDHVPSAQVPLLEPTDFVPRGGTALVDAVCTTLVRLRDWSLSHPETERPRVMVVIMT